MKMDKAMKYGLIFQDHELGSTKMESEAAPDAFLSLEERERQFLQHRDRPALSPHDKREGGAFDQGVSLMAKVDMHCHSRYSDKPVHWIFHKVGARESYIKPETLYHRQKSRGMDFVTITDHDVIDGALEIASNHDDAFVSCEFTCSFLKIPGRFHICVYDITEEDYRIGRRLSTDIVEFAAYFRERGKLVSVPHPLHTYRGDTTLEHLEKLVLLFENFEEFNGLMMKEANVMQKAFLDNLSPQIIERLVDKHGIEPVFPEPWKKGRVGGSDDHSSFFLASGWTKIDGEIQTYQDFLNGIREKRSVGEGISNHTLRFAHSTHTNVVDYFMENFCPEGPLHERATQVARLVFGDQIKEVELAARLKEKADGDSSSLTQPSREDMLIAGLTQIVMRDWHDPNLLFDRVVGRDLQEETFTIISTMFNTLVNRSISQWVEMMKQGRLADAFSKLALIAPTAMAAVPYIMGFRHFHSDNAFRRELAQEYSLRNPMEERPEKWAWFTDTVLDVNGVARTIQTVSALAEKHNTPITTMTCHPTKPPFSGHIENFKPIYHFSLPEYESMVMGIPPILDILRHCEKEKYTRFIISTPGPLGLVAMWVANILDIPTVAIYHTDIPNYARILTGDKTVEGLAWLLVRGFYSNVDQVYVLTEAYKTLLLENGVKHNDIRIFPKGTDLELYTPDRRKPDLWQKYEGLNGGSKILYVGRVSKEKDLDVLRLAYRQIREKRDDVDLVIVGDGPYLKELKEKMAEIPGVLFTGFVEGTDLAELYASSDVFAFPSTTDTYGSVVLEAQACGLPVVVSDQGGPKEVIVDGKTGIVTKAKNVDSFTEALLRLVDDEDLRESMGYEGRLHTENKSWENAFQTFWDGQTHLSYQPKD